MTDVKYDYDYENDSLFVYKTGQYNYDFSENLDSHISIDIDDVGRPIAFEILGVSGLFEVNKHALKFINSINARVCINEDNINFRMVINVSMHNKSIDSKVKCLFSNDEGLPVNELTI